MPAASLKPCSPYCPELTTGGPCPKHRRQRNRLKDANRPTAQQRLYDYRWSQTSQQHLRQFPLCGDKDVCAYEGFRGECHAKGRITKATCTDHIIPHKGDRYLFWDPLNRQSLCDNCNRIKAIRYEGGFGHAPSSTEPHADLG